MDKPADLYNQEQMQKGGLTWSMVTRLVQEWQAVHGLHADGMAGPRTQESLREDMSIGGTELGHAAVQIALFEVGNGEQNYGNNRGPHVDRYRSNDGTGRGPGGTGSWCASFASYCFVVAASDLRTKLAFKTSRGAKALVNNAAKVGTVLEVPEPGALISWHRYPKGGTITWRGHVGIVASYDPDTDTLKVVEGNKDQRPGADGGEYPGRVANVAVFTYPNGRWRRKLHKVVRV